MWDALLAVATGLLLAFATQQFAKGGWRWRSLTTARHELEVAAQLGGESALARALERRAHSRIERYLREEDSQVRATRLARLAAGAVLVALGGLLVLLNVTRAVPQSASLLLSGVLGALAGATQVTVRRIIMRPPRPAPTQTEAPRATPESP